MSEPYGATADEWRIFSEQLGLTADLLPVVSNPDAPVDPDSKLKGLGKTPSFYNAKRNAVGFHKWTENFATPEAVAHWASESDYGVCIQCRSVGAFDIDVEDADLADKIIARIEDVLDTVLPMRWRCHSGKSLLLFRRSFAMPKRVIPVEGGIIEVLGDGQQFIAAGTHTSGSRYEWTGYNPPMLTEDELNLVYERLVFEFATGEPRIAREKRSGAGVGTSSTNDPVAAWLTDNWEIYDVGQEGELFLKCPFESGHSTDSGPTSTAYFLAGTGGYERGHWVCLHGSCAGRTDAEFNEATGYALSQFADLGQLDTDADTRADREARPGTPVGDRRALGLTASGPGVPEPVGTEPDGDKSYVVEKGVIVFPRLLRGKDGRIESTAANLTAALARPDMVGKHIAFDTFKHSIVCIDSPERDLSPEIEAWRLFTDGDMVDVRCELETRGFKPMSKDLLRDCIHRVAIGRSIDTAQQWLGGLTWDGEARVERFAAECWGWRDDAYAAAVSRYLWTALAGRVMQPGVQADMTPVLVGAQGIRKTSAIKALVPNPDYYTEVRLDTRDADTARLMRGRLVGELEELRGLKSRDSEDIKAFLSRQRESWVPKFKEFTTEFERRLVFIASTNGEQFLADPTGERRWLPGHCGAIDVAKVLLWRDQLWAEGAARFALDGVDWREAETLAALEHDAFKVADIWDDRIREWLREPQALGGEDVRPLDKGYVTTAEVLAGALHIQQGAHTLALMHRAGGILSRLGLTHKQRQEKGVRSWVYAGEVS